MAVAVRLMTAAEYLAAPEDRPRFTELVNGTVVVHEPTLPHGVARQPGFALPVRSIFEP